MSQTDLALIAVLPPAELPALTETDLVDLFLRRQTAQTLRAYDQALRDFAGFVGVATLYAGVGFLLSHGQGGANRLAALYAIQMKGRGLAANTIAQRLSALKSVVREARRQGVINWALDVQAPKTVAYRDTRGPGDEGWTAMRQLAAADAQAHTPLGARNRAMLRVCHDLGLRVAELVSLDVEHVERPLEAHVPAAVWVLRKGKTGRIRMSLPEPTGQALAQWLDVLKRDGGPLFIRLDRASTDRTRLTTKSAARFIAKLGKRAGISRKVSPHQLRHHAITAVAKRNGGDAFATQQFSGHARLETVAKYIDHLDDAAGEMAKLIADED